MLFIGTSNVVLPTAKKAFPKEYQGTSRLGYYSTLFNSVEINSTFYKVPQGKTLERWALETTPSFRFTLKVSREITHQKGLRFNSADIGHFLRVASGLNGKEGCLLLQFPASITEDHFETVQSILEQIHDEALNSPWRLFVEFRHNSWYTPYVHRMVAAKNASIVIHDKPGSITPMFKSNYRAVYLRFHGTDGKYGGSYSKSTLKQYSLRIREWLADGKEVYAYFNNTLGSAFDDALSLRAYCER